MKLRSTDILEQLRERYRKTVEDELGEFDTDINRAVAEAGFPEKATQAKDRYLKTSHALERVERAEKLLSEIDLDLIEAERNRLERKADETHTQDDHEHQKYRESFQALDNVMKKIQGESGTHSLSLMNSEKTDKDSLGRRDFVSNVLQASGLLKESSDIIGDMDPETSNHILEERRELLELAETAQTRLRTAEYIIQDIEKKED